MVLNTTSTNLYRSHPAAGRYSVGSGNGSSQQAVMGRRGGPPHGSSNLDSLFRSSKSSLFENGGSESVERKPQKNVPAKSNSSGASAWPERQPTQRTIPTAEEEEEDVDEDELYLRLLALRSLAPDLDDQKLQEAVATDTLVDEMEELLDEADEAAEAFPSDEEAQEEVNQATLDLPGSDEEKMDQYIKSVVGGGERDQPSSRRDSNLSFLVEKMRKSLARQREREEGGAKSSSTSNSKSVITPTYSPTQSPIYEPGGAYSSPDVEIIYSPAPSRSEPEVFDLTESPPASPILTPENQHPDLNTIHLPPGSNSQSQELESSHNNAAKSSNSMALFLAQLPGAQPLPPGDEESYQCSPPPNPPSINNDPVDMELGSENEAEIQFFKDQQDPEKQKDSLFPPSVWGFGSAAVPQAQAAVHQTYALHSVNNGMIFSSDRERFELESSYPMVYSNPPNRRKRKHSDHRRRRRKSNTAIAKVNGNATAEVESKIPRAQLSPPRETAPVTLQAASEEEDDEESLRAILLSSMATRRENKQKQKERQQQQHQQLKMASSASEIQSSSSRTSTPPVISVSSPKSPPPASATSKAAEESSAVPQLAPLTKTTQKTAIESNLKRAVASTAPTVPTIPKPMVSKSPMITRKKGSPAAVAKKKLAQAARKQKLQKINASSSSVANKDLEKLKFPSVKKKHFPNLFVKTVISLAPDTSDEEEAELRSSQIVVKALVKRKMKAKKKVSSKATPPTSSKSDAKAPPEFGASLAQLLKEGRKNSEAPATTKAGSIASNATVAALLKIKKSTPPPKPIRKNPPLKQMSNTCLLYTSPSPRDRQKSRMPSSA